MNHLANETSPYLLQHKDNPVDWYPWGEEALARAKAEDKPILLSIGYSACHWCHVMAHESFEDEATAEIMNRHYVNIKVDREERPDLDDIYMQAVQAMTGGHGGWPMTVFLLPDGRPFYGGTYFPPDPRHGMPAFRQVLLAVIDAYDHRREGVESQAGELTSALQREAFAASADALDTDLLEIACAGMGRNFDNENGGFGGAPKFPNPMNLEYLLRCYARTGAEEALKMVTLTLRKMARGGIYDQLGGGFHRYSVDAIWLVPHFEKMLYDNAQLSRLYLHAWQVTGDSFFRRIAVEVYDYVLREMTAPEGGFYSTTDADSEGEEGKFFVWRKEDLQGLLGDDAPIAIEYWGVIGRGNFEGHNILHVPNDDDVAAQRLGLSVEALQDKLAAIKDTLYAHRTHRVHPGLDDKIVTAWNGMMLASLAEGARVFKDRGYRDAAIRSAEFLLDQLQQDGQLLRTWKDGRAKITAFLEDYANLIDGLIELYQTTFDLRWFAEARRLADEVLARFSADDGGFYDTGDTHEPLIARPRSLQDNATPSGNAMMAKCLARLAAYTGDARYDEAARKALAPLAGAMRQYPQAFGEGLNALDLLVRGIDEVAIVGQPTDERTRALADVVYQPYRPGLIVALSGEDVPGESDVPLLSFRTQKDGLPTVYVCRHFTCQMPVTTPDEVRKLLDKSS
ncbi:MAG: thioredoxin domain-containing protein [Anaerolineae bacterium]|nr:thioredoxin domain-containing protein [Anaerolineae bacterium]